MSGTFLLGVAAVVAVIALVVVFGILAWKQEQKRLLAIREYCDANGLAFFPERDRELSRGFRFLPEINSGDNRYAEHVIRGHLGAHEVIAFDHHYETTSTDSKGNRTTHHHHDSVFAVVLPASFPDLRISPEGVFSKFAQALGYDDIDFESSEFSKAFCVRSPDRKFAYDFCNPRMIELLLDRRSTRLGLHGNLLAQVYGGVQQPELIGSRFAELLAIRDRMPEYLFTA